MIKTILNLTNPFTKFPKSTDKVLEFEHDAFNGEVRFRKADSESTIMLKDDEIVPFILELLSSGLACHKNGFSHAERPKMVYSDIYNDVSTVMRLRSYPAGTLGAGSVCALKTDNENDSPEPDFRRIMIHAGKKHESADQDRMIELQSEAVAALLCRFRFLNERMAFDMKPFESNPI